MRHHQSHYRGIEVGSTFHQRGRRYVVNAASGESFESAKPQHFQKPFRGSIKYYFDAFTRFFKPYVLIATVKSNPFLFPCRTKVNLLYNINHQILLHEPPIL